MRAKTLDCVRVFVIHPHRTTLWALERLIEGASPAMTLAGSAASWKEALDLVENVAPHVILFWVMRAEYSVLDGIPALSGRSNAKILVLTGYPDPVLQDKAMLVGARGVVELESPPERILAAIKKVHEGELWIDHAAVNRVFVEFMRQRAAREADPERRKIAALTERERQIVGIAATHPGATAKTIADMLHISEHTLRNHLNSVYEKLQVANRVELFDYANKHNLTKPPDVAHK